MKRKWIIVLLLVSVSGFLLVELACAVVVKWQAAAMRSSDSCNLKQIGIALHKYASANENDLPEASIPLKYGAFESRLSWVVSLLPFMEYDERFKQFARTQGWDSEHNQSPSRSLLPSFLCPAVRPSKPIMACTALSSLPASRVSPSYFGVSGIGPESPFPPLSDRRCGILGHGRRVNLEKDIPDGLSSTIAVIETARVSGTWAAAHYPTLRWIDVDEAEQVGKEAPFGRTHVPSWYWRGSSGVVASALMGDGTVKQLTPKISPRVLADVATVAGGEQVSPDW